LVIAAAPSVATAMTLAATAKRAIRPAVIMRKITGGSRSKQGAKAWSILASVMRTAEQQGHDVLQTIKTLLMAEWAGKEVALMTDLV